jgi:hypothetical protein
MTTLTSYGDVARHRQSEIMREFDTGDTMADDKEEALLLQLLDLNRRKRAAE